MKIVTIGIYGYTAEAFFTALLAAKVDVFCDVRWRRGVRGKEYVFANHKRLQSHLESLGINYVHHRDLAPAPEIRKQQMDTDKKERVEKRKRIMLSSAFKEAYQHEVLDHFNPKEFMDSLPEGTRVVALCCVESLPEACHRSLLAESLGKSLGLDIEHLMPE